MKNLSDISSRVSRRAIALRAGLISCLSAALLSCQAQAPVAGVRLIVEPKQSNFALGEPVSIQVTVTNGGNVVFYCQPLSLDFGFLKIQIGDAKGSSIEYGITRVKDPSRPPAAIPPGGTYTEDIVLLYNFKQRSPGFPAPGRYSVRTQYRTWNLAAAPALVAETTVIVRTPQAGESSAGLAAFLEPEIAGFVENENRLEPVVSRLRNLAETNPNSIAGRYASFYLARHELQEYENKPANPAEAERLLMRCDVPGFPLRPTALLNLAEAARRQGQTSAALTYVNRALESLRAGPAQTRAQALRTEFLKAPAAASTNVEKPTRVSEVDRSAVAQVINQFFSAHSRGDLAGCLALLDADFKLRDALGKNQMADELREEFAKANRPNAGATVGTEILRVQSIDGGIEAEANLSFSNRQGVAAPAQRVRVHLVNRSSRWLIDRWLQ